MREAPSVDVNTHQTVRDPIYCWDWVMSYLLFVEKRVTKYIYIYISMCDWDIAYHHAREWSLVLYLYIVSEVYSWNCRHDISRANYIVSARTSHIYHMSQPLSFFNDGWRDEIIFMKLVLTWRLTLHLYSSWVESNDMFISSLCWLHGVVHKQLILSLFHFIHL